MAFLDQENPQAQVNQQSPVPAGGAGVGGPATKAAATPGKNLPAQPSAQLSAYLNANQPQTNQFAGNIASGISGQNQAAGTAINPAVDTYTGNLYSVPTNQAVNEKVSSSPSTLTPEEQATYKTQTQAANNVPNSANTFETTAPYQDITKNIQGAVEQANLWNSGNSVPNLTTALSSYEPGNATQGDKTLDALLLSQSPSAYKQITDATAPAANLQGQLDAGTSKANQALRDAISQDQATTAAAQAAPQTYATNLTKYLQDAVNSESGKETSLNSQILKDLTSNTPTNDDLTALGVTPEQWTTLSGEMAAASKAGVPINLSQYLTQGNPNVTAANTATAQQYKDVAALENLMGGNAPIEPISSTTASQAGTSKPSNTLDVSGAEIAAQIGPLEAQAQQIQKTANNANSQYQQNHFGGMSPGQFNNYIAGLNAQLSAINQKIKDLQASAPQFGGAKGVSDSSSGPDAGKIAENASQIVFPFTAPTVIQPIESAANTVAKWLGI